jgi:hypothetical protein
MRATTALGFCRSNGFVLSSDPNHLSTPDHLHDWYSLWDTKIGKPVSPGEQRSDGSTVRKFTNGYVVYNPPGESVSVTFSTPHRRNSDGRNAKSHDVGPLDGDIFIAIPNGTEQGVDQPATAADPKSEGIEKPKSKAEGRSQ